MRCGREAPISDCLEDNGHPSRTALPGYVANLPAKPILCSKNMVVAYASKVIDYSVHPRGEEPNLKRKNEKDSKMLSK